MAEQVTAISRALSDTLTGAYASKRITQEEIAERAQMSIWTVQKKLRGRSPISATDLVVLSDAIGVAPSKMLDDALESLAEQERKASEAAGKVTPDDRVAYLSDYQPPASAAADDNPRTPGKD